VREHIRVQDQQIDSAWWWIQFSPIQCCSARIIIKWRQMANDCVVFVPVCALDPFGKKYVGAFALSSGWDCVIDDPWLVHCRTWEHHISVCVYISQTCRSYPSHSFLCQLSVPQSQITNGKLWTCSLKLCVKVCVCGERKEERERVYVWGGYCQDNEGVVKSEWCRSNFTK
jgi:hypothetical protein